MEFNHYALGQRVRKFRRKLGLSQNEFSELIGRSTTFLSYIENGTKKMSIETFAEVAHALNMSMDELMSGCISGESKITSYDFSKILSDCSEYEKHILTDILKAAKQSLKANEQIFRNTHIR